MRRLVGEHPNPAKAADGKRLHALASAPDADHVVVDLRRHLTAKA